MKKLLLATSCAFMALTVAGTANAATPIVLEEEDGSLTGEFGATVTTAGAFTEEFTFEVPSAGVAGSTISTVAVSLATNIDFTSVLLNGTAFTLSPNGSVEFGFIESMMVAGGLQTLTVNGISGGNGSFAGTISFVPSAAVPEPATWALLMLGFAGVGASLRRRKPAMSESRVRYSFA